MSESWKKTVTNVSDKIFPGLLYSESYPMSEFNKIGNEIMTSLPLQMSLYFNVIFFPFWLVTMSVMLAVKIPELAAFWMISGLLSLPLQMFPLAKLNTLPQPAEIGAQVVMLVLLLIQLISGFVALRNAAKYLASKFQQVQLELASEEFKGEAPDKGYKKKVKTV